MLLWLLSFKSICSCSSCSLVPSAACVSAPIEPYICAYIQHSYVLIPYKCSRTTRTDQWLRTTFWTKNRNCWVDDGHFHLKHIIAIDDDDSVEDAIWKDKKSFTLWFVFYTFRAARKCRRRVEEWRLELICLPRVKCKRRIRRRIEEWRLKPLWRSVGAKKSCPSYKWSNVE